jgi:hypothetical protein
MSEISQINFKWREKEFNPIRLYRQFTVKDFCSQVGGLLGLFAGISVLSLVEFIYFFTIRSLTDLFRKYLK